MQWTWIVLGIVAVLILALIATYNGLVARRQRVRDAWANVDTELRRRLDLIPNVVETVKGYASHERGTLEAVVNARNAAMTAQNTDQKIAAENMLSGALRQLFALSEAYPDLKANQNMMQLSEELTSTENKIAFARQGYNDAVMNYNTAIESFPGSVVAGYGKFTPATLLESTE